MEPQSLGYVARAVTVADPRRTEATERTSTIPSTKKNKDSTIRHHQQENWWPEKFLLPLH
jgi:hypothetical protein